MSKFYYYCETYTAVSKRCHLRPAEGPRLPGGGVNKPTLCGLKAGWDIEREVVDRDVEALACPACFRAWKEQR